ncbi:MAG: hypothetical protein RI953_108 [Pseudomonadota bacterium]|jgi:mevalonate kinase
MAHPELNELTRRLSLSVPGKGMLFGEYGVMSGGVAAVAALHTRRMSLDFTVCPSAKSEVIFQSDFLAGSVIVEPSQTARLLESTERSEQRNLACYVAGWEAWLADKKLLVRVTESFSPELGFGSSSALLVAFQMALFRLSKQPADSRSLIEPTPDTDFWQRIHAALIRLQRKGSGYDLGIQTAALHMPIQSGESASLFGFRNQGFNRNVFAPEVKPIALTNSELSLLGCFVQSGVRSDTRAVLAETQKIQNSNEFCSRQDEWARSFCSEPTFKNARRMCLEASKLALEYGLLPAAPDLLNFVRLCDREGVAWKTMGAGHGDCLWVLATRREVEELILRSSASSMSVAFSFAEGV